MFSFSTATLLPQKQLFFFILMGLFAEFSAADYSNVSVYKGQLVILNCSISKENVTQINWHKDGSFLYAHLFSENQTVNNITSHRLIIDSALQTELKIFNVEYDDAGLYNCTFATRKGTKFVIWSLFISEKHTDSSSQQGFFLYLLIPVCALLLCGATLAVCFYRKLKNRTENLDSVSRQTVVYEVPDVLREQVDVPQRHTYTDHRKHQKHKSQYSERLNLIYEST
ncbi:uncharacterized protein LOC117524181 isoform X1 [Thalassophryne amazonica]|uniref:uncharacterized protein LOC117524181 isoform X1 n=1 Tax=Thalassophryne amazonica TaxID=390379 RepID=UPI001471E11B|nr:uncharacterized protein LOC117524181 isoform X1 [Thalassophryne amazonica]